MSKEQKSGAKRFVMLILAISLFVGNCLFNAVKIVLKGFLWIVLCWKDRGVERRYFLDPRDEN